MTESTLPPVSVTRNVGKRSRTLTTTRVKSISDGGKSVTYEDGWSYLIPEGYADKVEVGTVIAYETVQLSRVTAWGIVDLENETVDWAFQKSDEDLDAEDAAFHKKYEDDNEKQWEKFKLGWQERMSKLPIPLRARMELFHTNGGHAFELKGYGYELAVCELAALYYDTEGEETDEIKTYDQEHGCSGNQHDCAKALAKFMKEPDSILEFPAAFTPITGDPYYIKAGQE